MKERIVPVASDPPRMPLPATPSTPSMPFFERFKSRVPTAGDVDVLPRSSVEMGKELGKDVEKEKEIESDEESEFEGLAYADSDSDDGDGDEDTQKKKKDEGRILAVSPTSPTSERVRFPSVSSVATLSDMKTESRYSRETVQPLRVRSSSSSTSTSTSTSTSSSSGSGSRKSLNGIGASGENRKSSSGGSGSGEKRQSRKEKRQTIRMTGRGLDLAMATLLEEEGSVSGRGSMNVGNLGGGGSLGGRGSVNGNGRGSISGGGRGSVEVVPPLPSVRGPSTSESNLIINDGRGGGGLGGSERDSMRPKLPTRAKTTPSTSNSNTSSSSTSTSSTGHSNGSGGGATTKRRATDASSRRKGGTHTCLKCGGWIEDGRWIRMEGAGVMCDRCWKGMYLPKVSVFGLGFWFLLVSFCFCVLFSWVVRGCGGVILFRLFCWVR